MDSVTQIVVGIATVEALAGKQLKNKSFLYGALLGTLPDLDIWLGKLFTYQDELAFHRSLTHSFLGFLLLSPLLAACIRIWNKQLSFIRWMFVVLATLFTHTLIDLFTSWGVQLAYPHPARFSFKTIFVVDVLYTLPWIIALIIVFKKTQHDERMLALRRGFIWSSTYLVITVCLKILVVQKVKSNLEEKQITYSDFIVKPTFSNCILWNINVKTKDGFYLGDYSFFDQSPIVYRYFPKDMRLESQLKHNSAVQQLKTISEGWYILSKEKENVYLFNDLRFGTIEKEGVDQFVFSYKVKVNGDLTLVSPQAKSLRDGKKAIQSIWKRMLGNT